MTVATQRRYEDNTKVQPLDRRRVLGFAPNVPHMMASPLATNQPSEYIPQGQLIVFTPHIFPNLDASFDPAPTEKSPAAFANTLTMLFGTNGENDWGYRTLDGLTKLEYDPATGVDEADIYFDVVHPSFEAIGRTCEMGLEIVVDGVNQDKMGVSHARPCNRCRIEWLNSMECSQRMFDSGLDQSILVELKNVLLQGFTKANAFCRMKLDQTKGDLQAAAAGQPGKRAYQDVDYYYMSLLHEKAPHIQQADIIAGQNRDLAMAIVDATRSAGVAPAAPVVNDADAQDYADFLAFKAMKAKSGVTTVPEPKADAYAINGVESPLPATEAVQFTCGAEKANGDACQRTVDVFGSRCFQHEVKGE